MSISRTALRRRLPFLGADLFVLAASVLVSYLLRFDGRVPTLQQATMWWVVALSIAVKIPVFAVFRMYRFSWRHVGVRELSDTILACVTGSAALTALLFLLRQWPPVVGVSRSVLGVDFALTLIGIGGVRLSKRLVRLAARRAKAQQGKRTLIVGAGEAGTELARAIQEEEGGRYAPVGFVDDDPAKRGLVIRGLRVLGPRERLHELIQEHDVSSVIIAMPSAAGGTVPETVERVRRAGVAEIRIVPSLSQLYSGEVRVSELRDVVPEDLLHRSPVEITPSELTQFLGGKVVLVTGAAGSIGSEICRQILRFGAAVLIALDNNESALFRLDHDLKRRFDPQRVRVEVADIRDRRRMLELFRAARPEVVYHAAAYKHVPLMEAFPAEAVRTNVLGTEAVLDAARGAGVGVFVLISTDKAVNPTSVMGATKRLAERIVREVGAFSETRCVAVRFGNVLGSRGSVVPTFVEQIARGGPVTVTHPDMCRYFMVTSEAVLLVLQASAMGKGGEVFVLDMGEPVPIVELARDLIRCAGLRPDQDVAIVYTGTRPGEKLREELLTAEEGIDATAHRRVFVARLSAAGEAGELRKVLDRLKEACAAGDALRIVELLADALPSYRAGD